MPANPPVPISPGRSHGPAFLTGKVRKYRAVVVGALLGAWLGQGSADARNPPVPKTAPARLTVVAQANPTVCFVGQSVTLAVGVVAERQRPTVVAPKVDGAGVEFVRVEQVPISVSGIGEAGFEKNLFRSIYRVVPRRAGAVAIPPVVARLGDRKGRSEPVRLDVRPLPTAGRPAAFLGGVGRFEVEARAEPSSLRPGQSLEYRVTVTGPGARGVTSPPAIDRLATLPLGLQVDRLPDATNADPPSHTFIYRLRPTRAGEAVLPPAAVAAFDPESGRYVTKATAGVPLKVTEVAAFDPSALAYAPPSTAPGPITGTIVVWVAMTLPLLVASGLIVARLAARSRRRDARKLVNWLETAEGRLAKAADAADAGRVLSESLAAYLALTTGRPPGALTPSEAAEWVALATGSDDLAGRSMQLVKRCDRARFGGPTTDNDLGDAGRALLPLLAEAHAVAKPGAAE